MMRRLALVLLAALALAAGCGVPDDGQIRSIEVAAVPPQLVAESTTTSTPNRPLPEANASPVSFYLIENDTNILQRVSRDAIGGTNPTILLNELISLRPDVREADRGLTSFIPEDTEVLAVSVAETSRSATVDLGEAFGRLENRFLALAAAQIVFTLTEEGNGIDSVAFKIEGELTQIPDGAGQSLLGPLDRSDYTQFDPAAPDSSRSEQLDPTSGDDDPTTTTARPSATTASTAATSAAGSTASSSTAVTSPDTAVSDPSADSTSRTTR